MPRPSIPAESEWLSQKEASKQLGRSPTAVLRLGLLRQIRTRIEPGITPKYHRADVERIARETSPSSERG